MQRNWGKALDSSALCAGRGTCPSRRVGLLLASVVLTGLMLPVAGCAPQPRPPVRAAKPVAGNERVLLTLAPAVPRALDVVKFTVHVTGKDNRPVINAQVTADLSMPSMEMPPNTVSFTPGAPGIYTGQGRFSMPNTWAVTVTVLDQGKRTAAAFPITVR